VTYSDNWVGSGLPYHPHEFMILSDRDGDYMNPSNAWLAAYIEHNYQNGGVPRLSMQENKAINLGYGSVPNDLSSLTENRSTSGCNGVAEPKVHTSCYYNPPWYNDKEISAANVWFQPNPGPGYKGNWNHVEVYLQLNSVVGGVGVPDGVMQYWFKGALAIDPATTSGGARARARPSSFTSSSSPPTSATAAHPSISTCGSMISRWRPRNPKRPGALPSAANVGPRRAPPPEQGVRGRFVAGARHDGARSRRRWAQALRRHPCPRSAASGIGVTASPSVSPLSNAGLDKALTATTTFTAVFALANVSTLHEGRAIAGRVAQRGLLVVASAVLTFILIEGGSSAVIFVHDMISARPLAERAYTRYDTLLGWVNIPNAYIRDMYGPGVYLKTNAQGFRGNADVEAHSSTHKLRVICSGDSFTLGWGVDNDDTWCQLLSSMDRRWETVNMGQGGYGIDQVFLWYARDGRVIDHGVHIFAFISADFNRMKQTAFLGYPKPVLDLRDSALVVRNVPVPRQPWYVGWAVPPIGQLRSAELFRRVRGKVSPPEGAPRAVSDSVTWQVASRVFETLREMNEAQHSTLVLVHLPVSQDYKGNDAGGWRRHLREQSARTGVAFVDLAEELQRLTPGEVDSLFIGGTGHYSVKGNQWVARLLYPRLIAIRGVARKLASVH